ncbi:MAG: class I SAM-dependent RNA methyltransferase [Clostridiales bacterium]|nr:class I SAM-dependent RNA methyltransferase [Clostridiales bacterium]MDD7366283.1 class I SAM-dependent RNA methyltransferase [Clostridiales bacterium]MDY2871332.1 class I SAM-dependent RNA methyltransferase [Eubacteriales bacterium]
MQWIANTAFGLEGQTARDLKWLGVESAAPQPAGGVLFEGTPAQAFNANLWLRCADRVMLLVGRFEARSFEELFESVRALPWEDYIPSDGAFPIRAHCARSTLMSPSDCQSIVKKAIVERLKRTCHIDWFEETGAVYAVDVSIHADVVTICLDSSGPALNKRGYRTWNGEAPLRETMAAALVMASPWRPAQPLYDPCCGTGTLLIEAAFIALSRAPGLKRAFDCEKWGFMPQAEMKRLRAEAEEKFNAGRERPIQIAGSDIDGGALELARRHIAQAGLSGRITLEKRDLRDVTPRGESGVILCNPPYGERLGDKRAAAAVERQLGLLQERSSGWSLCAISGDLAFERNFGRRADKKRRFYNGRLECEFMTFLPPDSRAQKRTRR